MGNLKISSRLYILLAIVIAAFSLLLLIAQYGMSYLGDLQDAGFKRSSESHEMLITAKIGPVMYRVIADSIINRNLTESAKDWAEIKGETESMLSRASRLANTPEEKKWAEQARTSYQSLVALYESRVLPLLKADADLKQIRPLDDEMDKHVKAIDDALTPFAASLTAEAEMADKQFDSMRARIILGSLITALIMLGSLITLSLYVSRSIVRQLDGEPL